MPKLKFSLLVLFIDYKAKSIKILTILFLSTFLSYCSNNYFFDFDEIEHYKLDNKYESQISEFYGNPSKKEILDILEEDVPKNVEENYDKLLIKNGYNKVSIDKKKYSKISNVFKEKNCVILTETACIPVFRDILIFKKNNKSIGIAKICFECEKSHIVGSNKNIENFGQCGDFSELENILK